MAKYSTRQYFLSRRLTVAELEIRWVGTPIAGTGSGQASRRLNPDQFTNLVLLATSLDAEP